MIIETENLKKIYRTDVVETTAVNGVNFRLDEGEFVSAKEGQAGLMGRDGLH